MIDTQALYDTWLEFDKKVYREPGHIDPTLPLVFFELLRRQGKENLTILEIGTRHGSTAAPLCLFLSKLSGTIHLVDMYFQETNNVLDETGVDIRRYNQKSDQFFFELDEGVKFDLIHVDGGHMQEVVYRDVCNSLDHLADDGILCMDDFMSFYWYEVTEAYFRALSDKREKMACLVGGLGKGFLCRPPHVKNFDRKNDSSESLDRTLRNLVMKNRLNTAVSRLERHDWFDYHDPIQLIRV